jgi:CheY-like chemotaxis protein
MPKILIADDSIAVRKVAERLLTEAGMTVSLAANGTEALTFLGRECPDLVVSDVIMPDKSGYEVCSFVRAQPNLAGIPVLLISGIVNDEVTRQAETCHADGVLKKPFQGTSLKDRVHDLLAKHQAKTESSAINGKHPAIATERPVSSMKASTLDDRPVLTAAGGDAAGAPRGPVTGESAAAMAESAASPSRVDALVARIAELERALAEERERASHMAVQLQQAEVLAGRTHELERLLAKERDERQQREEALQTALDRQQEMQTALDRDQAKNQESMLRIEQLTTDLAEAQRHATEDMAAKTVEIEQLISRIRETEATLAAEREASESRSAKATEEASKAAARIGELEATLTAERDAATQLVEQITALEKLEGRVQDLDARLSAEREKSAGLERIVAELEQEAARGKELDAALITERERSALLETSLSAERQQAANLVQQVKEHEEAVNRARELDTVLAGERERSTQLARRATEAEQSANQSNRRLEEMARKLAEIAGLASQLANNQR